MGRYSNRRSRRDRPRPLHRHASGFGTSYGKRRAAGSQKPTWTLVQRVLLLVLSKLRFVVVKLGIYRVADDDGSEIPAASYDESVRGERKFRKVFFTSIFAVL